MYAPEQQSVWDSLVSMPQRAYDIVISHDWRQYPLAEIATAVGVGFFSGFLLRRYFQFLVIFLIGSTILLVALSSTAIISIDWQMVHGLTGLDVNQPIGELAQSLINFMQEQVVSFISFLVGFLIGFALI